MSFSSSSTKKIKIFFAYSQHRDDERLRQALEEHLHELRSLGVDSKWHKYQVKTEQDWEDEIGEDLNTADLIVMLVSPTFMQELNMHWEAPFKRAKARCEEEEVALIPVLLRQVNGWERVLGDLAPLPSNGRAVNDRSWTNCDEAFVQVAQGIVEKVEELTQYQDKLQEYEQYFSGAIQREEPLREYARTLLNQFKHTWNIKDKDIVQIEELVTQRQQEVYNQNLQKYKKSWFAATQSEYPISNSTRYELKSLQISLKLKDEDIARIEEQISHSKRAEIYTEIPKFSGVGCAAIVLTAMVFSSAMNSQDKSPSRLPSLASNQTKSLAPKTNDENFDGWIFIGKVKNTSYSPTVKKPLISASRSINSPVVPLKGNKVTVTKRVSLRQNRPQKPSFNHEETQLLGAIDKSEEVMILDTFIVPSNSTFTTVWAKVRKV